MNFKIVAAAVLMSSGVATSAFAAPPSPEQILAEASRYTVKIEVLNEIALNQDTGGSAFGAGFLVDRARGWIVTNAHVATRSPSTLRVAFRGEAAIEAKRIHIDAAKDLAVLAIDPADIPSTAIQAVLACDAVPSPGASLLAFGHPWGLSYTASRGILSGLAWFYPNQLIQTDAAINTGNSGGPLINLADGRVIGVNTATYQPDTASGTSTAIGLAEPIPSICTILDLLKVGGDARLRLLPVAIATAGEDLRPRVADVFDNKSGLKNGDIILRANGGKDLETYADLLTSLRGAGNVTNITVDRKGKVLDVTSPVSIVPDALKARAINFSGLIISEPWKLDDFEVNPKRNLVIDWYENGEEGVLAGAQVSDYIVSVDGQSFEKVDALYSYLDSVSSDQTVEIILRRASLAPEVHREYHHIELSRTKLEWVAAH
ncbi:MAG: trypsin-like peptidase domain-containing protein [Sphingobium sp.]|nr:MAG: trypsin-like peptidase domain-containing protein [Sphingobium sp.]